MDLNKIYNSQKEFYLSGGTKSFEFRKSALLSLKASLKKHEKELLDALKTDLNKSSTEAYMTEIGLVYEDINFNVKHLKKWMKKEKVKGSLLTFPSSNYIYREPYGMTLIMSPWNYPVLLSLQPVVGAVSGGNTVILRLSSQVINVSNVLDKIISEAFKENHVACILGDHSVADHLLAMNFDFMFFTGSTHIGKKVLESASHNLTPCILELGGKSPTIVTKNADIKLAARRIIFGKTINAGQTCVSPDYVCVDESIKDEFIKAIKDEISQQFPNGFLGNEEYPYIISSKSVARLTDLIKAEKVIIGGKNNERQIELTLTDSTFDSKVMEEEIFGPILPIITYKNLDDIVKIINSRATPLACYIFTKDKAEANSLINRIPYGGGCVNDCLMHLSTSYLPFGGLKESGMGQYHGKKSFDTFTHYKSVLYQKNYFDMSVRYHPFNKKKEDLIHKVLK